VSHDGEAISGRWGRHPSSNAQGPAWSAQPAAEPLGPLEGLREGRKCAAKPRRRTTHENGDRRVAVYGRRPLLRLSAHFAVRAALAALRFGAPGQHQHTVLYCFFLSHIQLSIIVTLC